MTTGMQPAPGRAPTQLGEALPAQRVPMDTTVDWLEVPRGRRISALPGLVAAVVVSATIVMFAFLVTDKWDHPGGTPLMAVVAPIAGVIGFAVAIASERLRGWYLLVPLWLGIVGGLAFLYFNDEDDEEIDNAVKVGVAIAGAALTIYVVPQILQALAGLRARFTANQSP